MNSFKFKIMNSPVGFLKIVVDSEALVAIVFDRDDEIINHLRLNKMTLAHSNALLKDIEKQLVEYFSKKRQEFHIPLKLEGTAFQKEVWNELKNMPYGSTCSYKDIAIKIRRPKAVRAVGAALGRNPIPIIIPCHRVVGTNGSLTGFSGGLNRKKTLLALENEKLSNL